MSSTPGKLQRKSQAVDVGSGVDLAMYDFANKHAAKEDTKAETPSVDLSEFNDWSKKPAIKGQYDKPGMWKLGDRKAAVFDLGDPKQLAAYNKLLARTMPIDSPGVVFTGAIDTKFHEGHFYTLVHYQEVLYRVLIKK